MTGSKGIGKAVACEFAKCQKHCKESAIVLVDKEPKENIEQCVEKLGQEYGVTTHAFQCDLGQDGAAKKLVNQIVEKFGKITALVNNAAQYHCGPLEKITEEDYHRVFDTNVRSTICLTAAALPHMSEGSSIVNISDAITHRPYGAHSLYTASKGAVEALTRALAQEVASKGIRVNTVSPGFTETEMLQSDQCEHAKEMTPMGRIGKVHDIAPIICFYLCDDSRWVTGQNLLASGGYGYAL
ncbi:hypothetical protein BC829DRAFT_429030 [Chytridium lagenaria]|nr:hypothetical protein BC829DRAFT_429030 [Chytridium lagenaria]